MFMLGNSNRGVKPLQKCLLYRTCVLPIATYGCRLWFFEGAKNKKALNNLQKMQRQACLWILGAFQTSPGGAIETIAGILPIQLHIKKLVDRSHLRIRTLRGTYVIKELLNGNYPLLLSRLTTRQKAKLKAPLKDAEAHLEEVKFSNISTSEEIA